MGVWRKVMAKIYTGIGSRQTPSSVWLSRAGLFDPVMLRGPTRPSKRELSSVKER